MFSLIRKVLFLLPPERAHYFTMYLLKMVYAVPVINRIFTVKNSNPITFAGLTFPNKIGLAAGFDKNGAFIHVLAKMGFGHIEVGTVTPKAQLGNPKPRLFRLPKDKALINRMGFNNNGLIALKKRLANKPKNVIIGGNIGKNKVTDNNKALEDYMVCLEELFHLVDYFTLNVSSPNTPGLRELQEKEPLTKLLTSLIAKRNEMLKNNGIKPIFLKIAPDMTEEQLKEIAEIVQQTKTDGIIISNTTIDRSKLKSNPTKVENIGAGGLSGAPVKQKSDWALAAIAKYLPKDYPIIGVGGIMNTKDAMDKLNKGAKLIQIYTGFVYGGLGLVKKLSKL